MSHAIKSFSFKTFTAVAFLSSALVAFSAAAQEQPAPAATTPSSAGSAQSAAPQTEEQKPAPQARVQKFDDWYYRCIDGKAADGSAAESCEVAQIATVKQGDQDVNVLTLAVANVPAPAATDKKGAKQPASELVLTTLVPLNMYLPAGLRIDVADKPVVQLAYRNCNQAGCWAQQKLDAKMVSALSKAADGTGHVQMMNGQKVNIKFSLKGLSAALDALQKAASN
ncbi:MULTISPECIES: invasion associated locus B family protein [Rhizobium]|uniref:Invasion associated locus B family protein n=1 Tax=Rhizobium tropici TaxID=398 RepID=A0A6P1C6M0_RHITR|nr:MULTISPECIES: invasion associated locus B family protein [Rhizobium]AGB73039.1 invasion associated locus B (IalB) family protein [Rhizobium tropici CIAT 899]MBB4244325.1 invasion protein IalB [Rhizobium tropici]MBB5595428.1 invasion protein IalB [Rhizobium tropici]MBB6494664.1 invasion protein IalB [Rhizobium tropici]NEV12820.1 invasion associated locus B family protein [Rhizobium tropici]